MMAMNLQRLVYCSQAWSLALRDRCLFDEEIEAWAYGPVVYALFEKHRGRFVVTEWTADDATQVSGDDGEAELIDHVIRKYGHRSGQQLSELTHSEEPWLAARRGLPDGSRASRTFWPEGMRDYYGARKTELTD